MSRGGFTSGGILSAGGGGGNPAFDAVASGTNSAGAGSPFTVNWTHPPVGTPTAIIVKIFNRIADNTISGVTYGGVAMTLEKTQGTLTAWKTTATPAAGAQTVIVSATAGLGEPLYCESISIVTGNATSPVASSNSSTGTSGTPSCAITGAVGNLFIDSVGTNNGSGATIAADVSQTERYNSAVLAGNVVFAISTKPGTASTTLDWTFSFGSPAWNQIVLALQ